MLTDKKLANKLLNHLSMDAKLSKLIDEVGPTPLRHQLDGLRTQMYNAICTFDQKAYEEDKSSAPKKVYKS